MSQSPRVSYAADIWKLSRAAAAGVAGADFSAGGWGPAAMQLHRDSSIHRLAGRTMGTAWSLRLPNPGYLPLEEVHALVQSVLDEVIAQMSNWVPDSLITRYNRAAAGSYFDLPPEFTRVLQAALHWAKVSGAALDPTMGALVSLWGFGPAAQVGQAQAAVKPQASAIAAAMAQAGHVRLNWQPGQALLQPGGVALDFCGIAKGFAVDWVVEHLQQAGWAGGLFEIGGELRAWGSRPDGKPWQVQMGGLATRDHEPLIVGVGSGSFATSGDYWHHFEVGGRRYSHTLDPRTGSPVAHRLASVSVFHSECMHADALATVLTVLGPGEGGAFAEQHGIAAVFYEHAVPKGSPGAAASPLITSAWKARFGT
jgi:thiamine biosynthesis lipoprotein